MKTTLLIIAALSALTLSAETPAPAKAEQTATPSAPSKSVAIEIPLALGEVFELTQAEPGQKSSLDKLCNLEALPADTSYLFGKTCSAVKDERKRFDAQKQKLIDKYGKVEGGMFSIPAEHRDEWNVEIKALTDLKITFSVMPIKLSALGENSKISPNDMGRLRVFLIDDSKK